MRMITKQKRTTTNPRVAKAAEQSTVQAVEQVAKHDDEQDGGEDDPGFAAGDENSRSADGGHAKPELWRDWIEDELHKSRYPASGTYVVH